MVLILCLGEVHESRTHYKINTYNACICVLCRVNVYLVGWDQIFSNIRDITDAFDVDRM